MKVIINDFEYNLDTPKTILEFCKEIGIEIPTLCKDERLLPNGACRLCIVEIEGYKTPVTACSQKIKDGMKIYTHSEKIMKMRREILDLLLIIHAEHGGGNNSAFATHVVSSSGTDTYSAISTGLGSLKGPRHGGANLKVSLMLENIRENLKNTEDEKEIRKYLEKILDKKAFDKKGLIYGLGHAVYTLSDPRAVLLKDKARELSKIKNRQKDFEFIEKIEKIGGKILMERLNKSYPICANVDLYSGFCYEMLDIPKDLYIPIFAIARTVGWSAHRLEQIEDSKIIRPAYKSLSQTKKYLSMDERWF